MSRIELVNLHRRPKTPRVVPRLIVAPVESVEGVSFGQVSERVTEVPSEQDKAMRHQQALEFIRRQQALYQSLKATLLERFEDEFVYFEDGQVLDHDKQFEALAARLFVGTEHKPRFVTRVERIETYPEM